MKIDYQDVLVHKPWGYEYLFYQNEQVAIWCLHINKGEATSLHCHPRKKTGLIMLSGKAILSFLNDKVDLQPLSKHILRPGLFHSTKAISKEAILLEVETPIDKNDLVRFEDNYERKNKSYEGKDKMTPLPKDYPRLVNGKCQIEGYLGKTLMVYDLTFKLLPEIIDDGSVIVILSGKMISDKGDQIVGPGDVGSIGSLIRLGLSFKIPEPEGLEVLFLCVPQH